MRIAILGAGAMGSLFGARLALAGEDVVLIDVNPRLIEAVRRDGLWLEDDAGERRAAVRIGAAADFADPVDLLILFTKAQHSAAALAAARHLVGPGSWVLTLQNGLGGGQRVRAALPDARIAIGTTNWPADLRGPGHVASHGAGEVHLWGLAGEPDPAIDRFAALLAASGLAARANPAAEVLIWEKAIFNSAMNPIAALTRLTVGGMAASADARALAAAVLDEAFQVASAEGVAIDRARVRGAMAHAYAEHGPHQPSMLKDVLAGRATEIDVINGAIVERAAAHGIAATVNETLARLVRAAQTGPRGDG